MNLLKWILIGGVCIWTGAWASPENEAYAQEAVDASFQLLKKLEADTPFSQEEGMRFFGALNVPSLNFLTYKSLGYIDGQGKTIRPLPAYSAFGELLRMHRTLLLKGSPESANYYASPAWVCFAKNKEPQPSSISHFIGVCITWSHAEKGSPTCATLFLHYNAIGKCFMEPILIDGKPLVEIMGLRDNRSEFYPTTELVGRLQGHLERLQKKPPPSAPQDCAADR